jgi:phage-related protein
MTQIEVSFDEKTPREVLFGDKDVEVLLENVMNEMMEAELTEHIGARPSEDTDTFRIVYVAKLSEAVFVLDAFKKKSPQ